eukprot:TRINITY_DN10918_c0_g1_i13.p1 TRINITY_DN10918_c0_g1~~TRINITY_DN10918_c0_g1_i13.p1  ORF type:complete len:168 (-),score=33.78 TRINITY_DN10918_c0_g1_i13:42-545(-)
MQHLAPVLNKPSPDGKSSGKRNVLNSKAGFRNMAIPCHHSMPLTNRRGLLQNWQKNQSYIMRSGELSPERKMLLQQLAPVPEKAQSRHEQWEENLSEPQSWIRAHGNTLLSRSATDTKEKSLAAWLQDQNRRMKSEELSPARKKMMQPAHPVAAGGIKDVAWCPTGT